MANYFTNNESMDCYKDHCSMRDNTFNTSKHYCGCLACEHRYQNPYKELGTTDHSIPIKSTYINKSITSNHTIPSEPMYSHNSNTFVEGE